MRRRTLLGSFTAALAAVAGCTSPWGTEPTTDERDTTEPTVQRDETAAPETTTETASPTAASTATRDDGPYELDQEEASVVAVSFEESGDDYQFSVTLHSADETEDGYANWWVVESLDGTELGRRELLHPHEGQPFTRSETISIPEGTTCVVVRGHHQTHGYGGLAMIVNLETGDRWGEEQGSERQSFADVTC